MSDNDDAGSGLGSTTGRRRSGSRLPRTQAHGLELRDAPSASTSSGAEERLRALTLVEEATSGLIVAFRRWHLDRHGYAPTVHDFRLMLDMASGGSVDEAEHVDRFDCWCGPVKDYEDPASGNQVWVHREVSS